MVVKGSMDNQTMKSFILVFMQLQYKTFFPDMFLKKENEDYRGQKIIIINQTFLYYVKLLKWIS